ncbi:MinD-like ATPase involved in chromosome partitioning or flagellar assembly [Cryobacterium sp. MP_M5]|uniref:AAA family ATPase n=1 Tax=unclassified Cryobacterium TaxID=2649013 RepID=UPI0018CB24EE|nr:MULTISPECIES: regulator [unclassified Cryobacterium]MBG6059520.1 MinD-like ATPase involved in chromosome partitioning or flagellar assembly [Cryobacterium sp. MP_M3]MEC5177966.1 MinD-like ATPase involved in chromosome partitioning or flagellar assembly [Cryobacterium sp. MP_M5]
MATLALALPRRTEDRLLADIVEHGHAIVARAATVPDLLDVLSESAPDVVIAGAARGTLGAELIAACDANGVRLIALAETDADRRHAVGLGLFEVLDASAAWSEIQPLIVGGIVIPSRIEDPSPPVAVSRTGSARTGSARTGTARTGSMRTGSVIAVWGPAGSPGRTTLAINIAAEIAAAGHTVVLADIDTYSGSVAPTLGMLDEAPGFAAACRLAGSDSLTRSELERIAQRYASPSGAFWVLTGIGRPSRWPELSGERVTRTIDALRHWVDYVVLDTGFSLESDEEISSDLFAPRRNAATLAGLRECDHVVACGLADPVGMSRFLRAWVDLAEVITTDRVSVVMNRVRSSAVGLDPRGQVVQALRRFGGIESAVLVPQDQQGADAAVLAGRTLRDAAPKSPARVRIRRFVRAELLPVPAQAPTGPRARVWWRRAAAAR